MPDKKNDFLILDTFDDTPHSKEIVHQTADVLAKSFDLSVPTGLENLQQLLALLTPIVKKCLDFEFEKLLQFCYRIDLSEDTLKKILHQSPPERMAEDLSRAIIIRQCQKFELRKKYSV